MPVLTITEDDARVIGEEVGAATMCWDPKPTGVFDSQQAAIHCKNIQDKCAELMAKAYEQGRKDAEAE